MSWDADLVVTVDGHELTVFEQNYTHNCNGMIAAALDDIGLGDQAPDHWLVGRCWFDALNGTSGATSVEFLGCIVAHLEADPDRYRAMNPENGWGSFDTLVPVLRKMCDAAIAWPSATWRCNG